MRKVKESSLSSSPAFPSQLATAESNPGPVTPQRVEHLHTHSNASQVSPLIQLINHQRDTLATRLVKLLLSVLTFECVHVCVCLMHIYSDEQVKRSTACAATRNAADLRQPSHERKHTTLHRLAQPTICLHVADKSALDWNGGGADSYPGHLHSTAPCRHRVVFAVFQASLIFDLCFKLFAGGSPSR